MPTPPARLAARTRRIAVSATAAMAIEADRLRGEGRDLVDFGVGEPDFPTPAFIAEAAIAALRRGDTKYTPTGGTRPLKRALVERHARDYGSAYAPGEALITTGGKQALFHALSVLVDHGDEVILPAPYWVSFRDQIQYAGGTPVILPLDEARGFALDLDALERALTPRTRMILLNSPANPSGAVFPPDDLRRVLEICRRRGLWLLSDECYVRLIYDGAPYSIAGEAGAKEQVVIAGSFSKTYAMTGWRMGFALGPQPVIEAMLTLQSQSTGNATTFVQAAALAALTAPPEAVDAAVAAMIAEYRRRRALIVEGLRALPGVRCALPSGAFYAYPNVRGLLGRPGGPATPAELAQRLLHQAGVVTVPGEAFGTADHLRFSYACSEAVIGEGLRRCAQFAAALLK